MELETKTYQKESQVNIKKMLLDSMQDTSKSWFLAKQLAVRDIKAQYRQSYLGLLWIFITPLLTGGVWIFLNLTGTVGLSDTGIPYPIFVFSGTLLWSVITEAVNSPAQSTNAARGLMSKLNFPKEALIISGIYKLLFNSSVKVILLVIFVFVFGIGFHWSLLLLPVAIFGSLLFGTTIGLIITPIGMLYTDVSKIISMGFRLLMFVSPVLYTIPDQGLMRTVMQLNPITPIIETGRSMLTGTSPEFLGYFLVVIMCCIPLFLLGLLSYKISIPIIVERSA